MNGLSESLAGLLAWVQWAAGALMRAVSAVQVAKGSAVRGGGGDGRGGGLAGE